jgi:hypothetical protein
MLHEDPSMLDIDVNHWRNLQTLLLESAKEKRRIILIHENGELLKFVHSERVEIVKNVDRVDDPHAVAEKVYKANADKCDFVAVFERRDFDSYMGQWQGTWRADEDLDTFVQRTYATLDEYPDGMVTYPGPAREQLGLQWRLGTSYAAAKTAVEKFVPANSTVVFGILDGESLWATLVLGFDGDRRARVVTTVDMSELPNALPKDAVVSEVVGWVNKRYGPCSIGLFVDLADARAFLGAKDKLAAARAIVAKGGLRTGPVPEALAPFLSVGSA